MNIRNFTPHPVIILQDNAYVKPEIRKLVTPNPIPIQRFESEGMLSADQEWIDAEPINEIRTLKMILKPSSQQPAENEYYIISTMYLIALKEAGLDTSRYLTIGKMVFDEEGKTVVGCLGLVRN